MAQAHDMHPAQAMPAASFTYTTAVGSPSQVINLREPQEVHAWLQLLGCSEEHLRRAIAAVGPELQEVCNHLGTLLPAQPLDLATGNRTAH
jgi:hypothetical protein